MRKHIHIYLCIVAFLGLGFAQQREGPAGLPSVTATIEHTYSRDLTDGNKIVNNKTGQFFRDSQGRTRMEQGNVVVINDPTTRTLTVLDLNSKVARRFAGGQGGQPERGSSRNVNVSETVGSQKPGAQGQQLENLGTRVIEGLRARGKRFSVVVPPGAVGNMQPITQVSEVWVAEELGLPILMKASDPMNGEHVQRYQDIVTGVQVDPALFAVPAGFAVSDGRATVPDFPGSEDSR